MKINLYSVLPIIFNILGFLVYLFYIYKLSDNSVPLTNKLKSELSFALFTFIYLSFILLVIICFSTGEFKDKKNIIFINFGWVLFITPFLLFKENISYFISGKWDITHMAQDTEVDDWIDTKEYDQETGKMIDIDPNSEKYKVRRRAAESERNERIEIDNNIYA